MNYDATTGRRFEDRKRNDRGKVHWLRKQIRAGDGAMKNFWKFRTQIRRALRSDVLYRVCPQWRVNYALLRMRLPDEIFWASPRDIWRAVYSDFMPEVKLAEVAGILADMKAAGLLCRWCQRGRLLNFWLPLDEDGDPVRPTSGEMRPRRVLDSHFKKMRRRNTPIG